MTCRCIKWDPLCGPLPKALTDLDLTVIEGVLKLFADWGTVVLLSPRYYDVVTEAFYETKWCHVLGPGLCGYMHSCDPNVLLIAQPHEEEESVRTHSVRLKLVTTRAISKGEIFSCHYGGYAGLPAQAFAGGSSSAIVKDPKDEQQAAAAFLRMLGQRLASDLEQESADAQAMGAEEKSLRALLCKLAAWVTGDHWISNACRTVLLQRGAHVQLLEQLLFVCVSLGDALFMSGLTCIRQEWTKMHSAHSCGFGLPIGFGLRH